MCTRRTSIRVERIAPGCPEQNGSHEPFHRVLKRGTTRPPAPLDVTRALADRDIGLEEIDDAFWRVWFLATPLGHFDARRWRWVSWGNLD